MKNSAFFILIVAIWALNCSFLHAQTYDEWIERSFDYIETDSIAEAETA